MKIELSEQNKNFILNLLFEEKNRLISRFRKKSIVDFVGAPCNYYKQMYYVLDLISILGDADE